MSNLLPTLSDALAVHTQAHEAQSGELHDVALKLLNLCGQTHICTDGLDADGDAGVLDNFAGAFCLDAEAASVGSDGRLVSHNKQVADGMKAVFDTYCQHKPRTPAYELWLVRKADAEPQLPECPFKIGDYVPVGWPRKHGAYRFPVAAQKVGDGYLMLQVHKDGDKVAVFGKDGNRVRGMADVVDAFVSMDKPNSGIFEMIVESDGAIKFWDVLVLDGVDCTKLPYAERAKMVFECAGSEAWQEIGEATVVNSVASQDGLHKLEAGTWLIRHEHEVLTDLLRPFHFVFDAGTVRAGTVLPWVKPSGKADKIGGLIEVADTGLPTMQIHKSVRGVSVFISEGGRNRAANLPQVVKMAESLPEQFVMECMVTVTEAGVPVSAERLQNPSNDLSECEVEVFPFDMVLWGDRDLSGLPMYERVEMLSDIVLDAEIEGLKWNSDAKGEKWLFDPDSVRPLNGDCGHCFTC